MSIKTKSPSNGTAGANFNSDFVANSEEINITQNHKLDQESNISPKRFIELPCLSRLTQIIRYDDETGELISIGSRGNLKSGSKCGTRSSNKNTQISINGIDYQARRFIWKMHFSVGPKGILIHKAGKTSNNRVSNLLEVVQ